MAKDTSDQVRKIWERLSKVPGGRFIYSRLISLFNPYSGGIGARIEELGPGYCVARLKQKRSIENPFRSIHAIAQINLAELVSGLALNYGLPKGGRCIPIELNIKLVKKVRGSVFASCKFEPPISLESRDMPITVDLKDKDNNIVAESTCTFRVGS